MISNFWLLEPSPAQRLAEWGPDTDIEQIVCPAYDGHRRGGKRLGNLSVVVHPSGVKDMTWTWQSDILVSQEVLDLFEKYRVTGFEAKRARTSYPKNIKAPAPALFELVVTGWGGFAAPAAGVSLVESCPACGHKVYAIAEPSHLIDAGAWDGSDLFIVWPLPRYRFVSDRLASILRQERVSGVVLIPASKIDMGRGTRLSPGSPLTMSMPERRARELDQRFGISHWLDAAHNRAHREPRHF
jgi:hypothetical protein